VDREAEQHLRPLLLRRLGPILGFPLGCLPFPLRDVPRLHERDAFANTRIDWKETPEAHSFKVDLPWAKEEVKVEMEEG
ncbi:hypothetical protein MUK42_37806, partial [Musa troglodytarum]